MPKRSSWLQLNTECVSVVVEDFDPLKEGVFGLRTAQIGLPMHALGKRAGGPAREVLLLYSAR